MGDVGHVKSCLAVNLAFERHREGTEAFQWEALISPAECARVGGVTENFLPDPSSGQRV